MNTSYLEMEFECSNDVAQRFAVRETGVHNWYLPACQHVLWQISAITDTGEPIRVFELDSWMARCLAQTIAQART